MSYAEMPTSGDLKSGDCLFCITVPPSPNIEDQTTPLPIFDKH